MTTPHHLCTSHWPAWADRLAAQLAVVLAMGLAGCASVAPPRDAAEVIRHAEAALGSTEMRSLVFRGRGLSAAVGQSASPEEPWPVQHMRSFSRAMHFDERAYREDFIRGLAAPAQDAAIADAAMLRGPQPGESRGVVLARQAFSWDVVGVNVAPAQTSWQARMHDLWLSTPQGALKAAGRHNARAGRRFEGLRWLDTLSFQVPGQFSATLFLEADGRVLRIESVLPEPLLGDVAVRTQFIDYQPQGGLRFPRRIVQHHDDVLVLDVQVRSVGLDEPLQITVPENVRTSGNAPAVLFISDGVWLLGGGTHHSLLVEQAEQLVLVEAPLDDERGRALVNAARRLVDSKRVRAVVVTHHHLDHLGGLRVLAGEGAVVYTSRSSSAWLQAVLQRPLARRPDPLAALRRPPEVRGVGAQWLLDDAQRPVQLLALRDSPHTRGLLMVWLPRERLLVHADADALGPPSAGAVLSTEAATIALLDQLEALGIAPLNFVSLHGRLQSAAEVSAAAGRSPPP